MQKSYLEFRWKPEPTEDQIMAQELRYYNNLHVNHDQSNLSLIMPEYKVEEAEGLAL